MAKKKKKKKPVGARRPTYAKGKKVESSEKGTDAGAQTMKPAQKSPGKGGAPAKGGESKGTEERQQWNLIREGTLEMKVFLALALIIVAAAVLQYPLRSAEALTQYNRAKADLKKWEVKYPKKEDQKKHAKEKPVVPPRPTFGVLMIELALAALQGLLFAFIGLNVSRRTDLETPLLNKLRSSKGEVGDLGPLMLWAVPAGLILLLPLLGKTAVIARYFNEAKANQIKYPLWKYSLSGINDGVQFQVLFVFLVVSVFVWLFARYRDRMRFEPHWAGIAAAFLFAAAFIYLNIFGGGVNRQHVTPGTMWLYAFTFSLPVLVLGYLYWKKGLEYSLLAGVIGFGIYPFLAPLIIK